MRNVLWAMLVVVFVMAIGSLAWADDAAKPAAVVAATGILATGALGGLWKGVVTGIGRALVGYFSNPTGSAFEMPRLIATAIAGALAGLLCGLANVPYDQAWGWLATAGATELLAKVVKGLWNRWLGDRVGETVTRALARSAPRPPGQP